MDHTHVKLMDDRAVRQRSKANTLMGLGLQSS
jgi:hypothetical protein